MSDNLAISCEDIREKLKSFQEDLLSEEDYRNYILHLDCCATCREYVGAIGSVSNQIWELGKLKIPGDLGSTILFQYNKLKDQPLEPEPGSSRKTANLVIVALFIVVMFFLGINYLQSCGRPKAKDAAPFITAPGGIKDEKTNGDQETEWPAAKSSWESKVSSRDIVVEAPKD